MDWAALGHFVEFVGVVGFIALVFAVLGYLLLRLRENSFGKVLDAMKAEGEANNRERDRQWQVITDQREDGRALIQAIKALETTVSALPEVLKTAFSGAFAPVLENALKTALAEAEKGHASVVQQVNQRIDLAQAGLVDVLGDALGKTGEALDSKLVALDSKLIVVDGKADRIAAIEEQVRSLPAALAGALAKEFAPIVADWGKLRQTVEHAVGGGLRDTLRAMLDEQQKHLEAALERAAQSTISTVTNAMEKMAEQVTVPITPPVTATAEATRADQEKT